VTLRNVAPTVELRPDDRPTGTEKARVGLSGGGRRGRLLLRNTLEECALVVGVDRPVHWHCLEAAEINKEFLSLGFSVQSILPCF
jgi:hypothetical protein